MLWGRSDLRLLFAFHPCRDITSTAKHYIFEKLKVLTELIIWVVTFSWMDTTFRTNFTPAMTLLRNLESQRRIFGFQITANSYFKHCLTDVSSLRSSTVYSPGLRVTQGRILRAPEWRCGLQSASFKSRTVQYHTVFNETICQKCVYLFRFF